MATELITYSNPGGQSADKPIASGLLTSDGTLVNIVCGFQPSKIVLYNYTGTNPNIYIWVKGLAVTNTVLITGSTGVVTKGVTGPAVYADDDGEGFTIPAALLTDADTWMWEAYR